jgi:two-component system cell cycle sensor histidine kinase/response regulator CckA
MLSDDAPPMNSRPRSILPSPIEVEHQKMVAARMESVSLLAGVVAHDLNNMLTVVLGFGALLAERVAGDAEAAGSVREVLAAGERAATLSQRLLAFSRRQALSPQPSDLSAVVKSARSRLAEIAGGDVALEIHADQPMPPVLIDVGRIEDALATLVENAREAMAAGGHMSVEVSLIGAGAPSNGVGSRTAGGTHVRILVRDSGRGIPVERQDRVFDPFFTTKTRAPGAGLGLSIVHGFVKQTGGTIKLRSEVGLGTAVEMDFPVVDRAVPAEAASVPDKVRSIAGKTVLVVDDAEGLRAMTGEALRRAGYRVLVASSAADALYMAHNHRGPIHALVTDIVMPGGNGRDLAGELRTERTHLKVLYMSGHADNVVLRSGPLAPHEVFLAKPFTPDLLLQTVGALLR